MSACPHRDWWAWNPPPVPRGEGAVSCADAPAAPLVDVARISFGLDDGVYYAGRQLAPWMTVDERAEHRRLRFDNARVDEDGRRRLDELRRRRASQSIVIRWDIADGVPSVPTTLTGGWTDGDEPHAAAFTWGTGTRLDFALAHAILEEVLAGGRYRSESSNRYVDVVKPKLPFGAEWVISQRAIAQAVARQDFVESARQAIAVGLDPAEPLRWMP